MKDYLIKRPMLLGGVLCCIVSAVGFYFSAALLLIGIILAVLIGIMIFRKSKPQTITAVLLCVIMLISMFFTLSKIEGVNKYDGVEDRAELIVCEEPRRYEGYYAAVVETVDSKTVESGIKMYAFFEPQVIEMGEIIIADLEIKEIEEKYKKSNYSSGIYLNANMSNIKIQNGRSDFVLTKVAQIRKYIKSTLFSNMGYEQAATLCALLFGDRDYFTDEFYANVKKSGVSHVMVVSGMHLSILVTLFAYIIDKFMYNRYAKAFITVLVVLGISALCGFTMSILRAGITYFITALSLVVNRKSTPENTLGAAVCIILISSPLAVHNIALQLSLLSTFGILVVAVPAINYMRKNEIIKKRITLSLFSAAVTSVSAMVLTMPVVIYVYNYVSTVAIITNLLISGAVTVVLWISVCGLIINLIFPAAAELLFTACEFIVEYINSVINYFGSRFYSTVDVPKAVAFVTVLLIILLFKILLACKVKHNMLELNEIKKKIIREGGKTLKWR